MKLSVEHGMQQMHVGKHKPQTIYLSLIGFFVMGMHGQNRLKRLNMPNNMHINWGCFKAQRLNGHGLMGQMAKHG